MPNIAGSVLSGLGGIANAQNSDSTSQSTGSSDSWGSSASNAWNQSSGYTNLDAYSNSNSWSKSFSDQGSRSESQAFNEAVSNSWSQGASRTYGKEASAQDIQNAAIANQIQKDLWSDQAAYNAKQAEIDREFQAAMSNTAYQRAVIDLLHAGLNPILAVGNMGASTPVGAMASSGLASSHKANAIAEQESYSNSASDSYSYGKSRSDSSSWGHSESASKSKSKSKTTERSRSQSSGGETSSSNNRSKSREDSSSMSKTRTQLNDLVNAVSGLMEGGSAKDKAKTNSKNNNRFVSLGNRG